MVFLCKTFCAVQTMLECGTQYEKVPMKQLAQPPPFDSLIWKSNGKVIASQLHVCVDSLG